MRTRLQQFALLSSPVLVLAAVLGFDLTLPPQRSVASLCVIIPLLAASMYRPLPTAGFGVVAVTTWYLLSRHHQSFAAGMVEASVIRGIGVGVGALIAVAASLARCRREEQASRVAQVADTVQRAILAPLPERIGPVRLATLYRSAALQANVGGDFFDAAATPFGVRVIIGDVRGNGLDAVRMSAEVLGAFRERRDDGPDLVDLIDRLSAAATRRAASGDFVTATLLQITDDGVCTAVTAGHPQPILVRDGEPSYLPVPASRPPLVLAGVAEPISHRLAPGEQIVLYTDGVTEARRPADRVLFGEDRLLDAARHVTEPAQAVDSIFARTAEWAGQERSDDIAIVAVQYAPRPTPTTFGSSALLADERPRA